MMTFEAVHARAHKLPGWCADGEARRLYDLASAVPGPIIEVGTWCGRSSCYLAAQGVERVFCVDPYDGPHWHSSWQHHPGGQHPLDLANSAWRELGLAELVTSIVDTSPEAVNDPRLPAEAGLVYIDGGHEYDEVMADLRAWAPKVICGGYVALHDYTVLGDQGVMWGVRQASEVYFEEVGGWEFLGIVDTLGVWRRTE